MSDNNSASHTHARALTLGHVAMRRSARLRLIEIGLTPLMSDVLLLRFVGERANVLSAQLERSNTETHDALLLSVTEISLPFFPPSLPRSNAVPVGFVFCFMLSYSLILHAIDEHVKRVSMAHAISQMNT